MVEDKIKISIDVAQRSFEMTVKKELESYYREVEEIIKKSFLDSAKKWTYNDHQDILSKMLIEYVAKWKENEERLAELDAELVPKMQELKILTDEIDIS